MKTVDDSVRNLNLLVDQAWLWLTTNSGGVLMALLAAAIIIAVIYGLKLGGIRIGRGEHLSPFRTLIGRIAMKTQLWFMIAVAAEMVADTAAPPPAVQGLIHMIFTIATALQGAIWVRELALGWIEYRATADGSDHSSLVSAMGIIRLLISVAVFAVAVILILDNLGVNVTALVAGLGIGGIAIGLAAQGIFSDLFAALSILFDRPFRKGDAIAWDTRSGTVEEIGLKTTRVRALTGELLVVSNANLLSKELANNTRIVQRRVTFTLGLIYQTPVDTIEQLPAMLRAVVDNVENCLFSRGTFVNFSASSIDFELVFDVATNDYNIFVQRRMAVAVGVLRLFEKQGIEFAYPTQTTFTAAPDGTMIMPYPAAGDVVKVADGKPQGDAQGDAL